MQFKPESCPQLHINAARDVNTKNGNGHNGVAKTINWGQTGIHFSELTGAKDALEILRRKIDPSDDLTEQERKEAAMREMWKLYCIHKNVLSNRIHAEVAQEGQQVFGNLYWVSDLNLD